MKRFFSVFNAATLESFQVLRTSEEFSTAAEAGNIFLGQKEPFEGEAPTLPARRQSETEHVVEGLAQTKKGNQKTSL